MSKLKILAVACALVMGASTFAAAQSGAAGGGAGTVSGHPEKAQNNDRGPGKNPGGPGQGQQ
jgi:hypothetical protein